MRCAFGFLILVLVAGAAARAPAGEGGEDDNGLSERMHALIIDQSLGEFAFEKYFGDTATLENLAEALGEEYARDDLAAEALYRRGGEADQEVSVKVARLAAATELAAETEGLLYSRLYPALWPALAAAEAAGQAVLSGQDENQRATIWSAEGVLVVVTCPAAVDPAPVVAAYLQRYPSRLSATTLARGYAAWRTAEVARRLAQYRQALTQPAGWVAKGFTARNFAVQRAAIHADGIESRVLDLLLTALEEAPNENDVSKNAEQALAALRLLAGERLLADGDPHDEACRERALAAARALKGRREDSLTIAQRLVANLDAFLADEAAAPGAYARLEALTGEHLGQDAEAWKAWAQK